MELNLTTKEKITWCPGCPNSQILVAFRQAVNELIKKGDLKTPMFQSGSRPKASALGKKEIEKQNAPDTGQFDFKKFSGIIEK